MKRLTAIRKTKERQIEDHFARLKNEVSVIAANPHTIIAAKDLTHAFSKLSYQDRVNFYGENFSDLDNLSEQLSANQSTAEISEPDVLLKKGVSSLTLETPNLLQFKRLYKQYDHVFNNIAQKLNFENILIVNARSGDIAYAVTKNSSFNKGLVEGARTSSDGSGDQSQDMLHKIFTVVISSKDQDFVKLSDFVISQTQNSAPASYIGCADL